MGLGFRLGPTATLLGLVYGISEIGDGFLLSKVFAVEKTMRKKSVDLKHCSVAYWGSVGLFGVLKFSAPKPSSLNSESSLEEPAWGISNARLLCCFSSSRLDAPLKQRSILCRAWGVGV